MEIKKLVNGVYKENCYVLSAGKDAVIIDPGVDYRLIEGYLRDNGLTAQAVLITHAHFDHCQCAHNFENSAKIYISKTDYALAQKSENIPLFKARFFEDEKIELGGHEFKIIFTPGHTEGSVCIEYNGTLFTGDTLFEGAVGRTDLPTGSLNKLKESLKKLCGIYDDIVVAPGHGDLTALSKEMPLIEYLQR